MITVTKPKMFPASLWFVSHPVLVAASASKLNIIFWTTDHKQTKQNFNVKEPGFRTLHNDVTVAFGSFNLILDKSMAPDIPLMFCFKSALN